MKFVSWLHECFEWRCCGLDIDPLLRVPSHIPTRAVAEVRKQRLDTNLILRRGKLVLSLAVLFVDRVHLGNRDRSELRAIVGNPVT